MDFRFGQHNRQALPGWTQTRASCDNGATPDNISLTPSATVRCIFTDTKLSSITVVKQAAGGNGTFAFTGSLDSFSLATAGGTAQRTFAKTKAGSLTVVGGNGAFGFTSQALGGFVITTTAGTGQQVFANLTPGSYDLTEEPAPGWELGLATCSNGSTPTSVTVAAGEAVIYTFENTEAMTKVYMPFIGKQ